jgi:hypothetical protein
MPRNANHGISALHVFVALSDAYIDGRKEVTLNELKRTLIKDLHEYLTDGRSRSAKRAVKILAEYSLVEESKNRFGEPVYSLKGKSDTSFSNFLNMLSFLEDMTKGRTGEKQILERIEAVLPAIIEVLRGNGCFTRVPKEKENIVISIFEALASEHGISLYAAIKFFHDQPQILRLYNMFAWLAIISEKYGDDTSLEIVLKTYYEVFKSVIPEKFDLAEVDEKKSESLLRMPSFKDIAKTQHTKTILNPELNLPDKVRRKLVGFQQGSINSR